MKEPGRSTSFLFLVFRFRKNADAPMQGNLLPTRRKHRREDAERQEERPRLFIFLLGHGDGHARNPEARFKLVSFPHEVTW